MTTEAAAVPESPIPEASSAERRAHAMPEGQRDWLASVCERRTEGLERAVQLLTEIRESGARATITVTFPDRVIESYASPRDTEIQIPEGPPLPSEATRAGAQ
jgi:hypothetical protein